MTADPSKAFDAAFRSKLADAVTVAINTDWYVAPYVKGQHSPFCDCPEGRAIGHGHYPDPWTVSSAAGFKVSQHQSFQSAFDGGVLEKGSPEAALGLLYRKAWERGWKPKGRYQQ